MRPLSQTLRALLRPHRPDPTDVPLLDRAAILDLLGRVRGRPPAPGTREVTHRHLGEERSAWRGSGLDYDESRPYRQGDEPRFMDWRLTARTGEPFVKVFREERRPGTFLLVDRRSPMRFGTRVRLKAAQAARVAALSAFRAWQRKAAVGAVLLEESPVWFPEGGDEASLFRLVEAAARPCPPLHAAAEPALADLLGLLRGVLARGSALYLISDFRDLDPSARPLLLQLASEHRLCAVHIVDPAELALPAAGTLRLCPLDGGGPVAVDTADPDALARFETAARAHLTARERLFTALGIPYVRLRADEDPVERRVPAL